MGRLAFVFPGQGAQYPGMGNDFYRNFDAAKHVFERAESLRPDTMEQCFFADKTELSETKTTQPCLFVCESAACEVLRSHGVFPDAVAGFSLGEIAALTFAQTFDFEDGFSFVCKRGALMQAEAEQIDSGMIAVLKVPFDRIESEAKRYDRVYPVNYNCPGQLVVAGIRTSLSAFADEMKALGGKVVPLSVSGGFHSPFMDTVSQALKSELHTFSLKEAAIPVYANLTGEPYGPQIIDTLVRQVNHPVLWQNTIEAMHRDGIDCFIEVGAGKTLSGMIKRILPDAAVYRVEDTESLKQTLDAIG
jgi:[acyl-carrier-protein] S-malonyltransferase